MPCFWLPEAFDDVVAEVDEGAVVDVVVVVEEEEEVDCQLVTFPLPPSLPEDGFDVVSLEEASMAGETEGGVEEGLGETPRGEKVRFVLSALLPLWSR